MFFTKYMVRRMPAEVLLDAINFATGTTEKFNRLPKGTRAISLPDPQVSSYFLDIFGRPQRLVSCECERTGEPNISQALDLMNGDAVQEKVASPQGRLAKLLEAKKSDDEILNDLYLQDRKRALTLYDQYLAMAGGDAAVTKWVADLKNRKDDHVALHLKEQQ